MKHPTVKVIACPRITIRKTWGNKYMVCLDEEPFEVFIHQERERQEKLVKEAEERSKDDLLKEVKSLRREVKRLGEKLQLGEQLNEA